MAQAMIHGYAPVQGNRPSYHIAIESKVASMFISMYDVYIYIYTRGIRSKRKRHFNEIYQSYLMKRHNYLGVKVML